MHKPPQSWKDLWKDEKLLYLFMGLGGGLAGAPGLRLLLAKIGVDDWTICAVGVAILLVGGHFWRQLSSSSRASLPEHDAKELQHPAH